LIVVEAEPSAQHTVTATHPRKAPSNLVLRIMSAVVLAPLALTAAYVGGWLFMVFWGVAAAGILWEWFSIVGSRAQHKALAAAGCGLLAAWVFAYAGRWDIGFDCLLLGCVAAALLGPPARRGWLAAGTLYAGIVLLAPILLRRDAEYGFAAIVFLFAVVWGTDIFAYLAGRSFGGPKLATGISPNKTWSGALGGAFAAGCIGLLTATLLHATMIVPLLVIALGISVVAQTGDLFESWVKRRFGAKNSSELIPGHGGLMDRLDGFATAALAAAIIGIARAGLDAPARGLMLW
jgi:phosphatidate cytidylyltransferase